MHIKRVFRVLILSHLNALTACTPGDGKHDMHVTSTEHEDGVVAVGALPHHGRKASPQRSSVTG